MEKKLTALSLVAVLLCAFLLSGCSQKNPEHKSRPSVYFGDYQKVEQVGQVTDVFRNIVQDNKFKDAIAFDGRLLKKETISSDKENRTVTHKVTMLDIYGNELATYAITSDDAYRVTTLTATDDGGFLFVLGFSDYYDYKLNLWASDKGFASRVIKCDKYGMLQFDTPFENIEGTALEFCIEKNGQLYFFGETQTPETKTKGVGSPTDIYMTILDQNGKKIKSKLIAGSDFESLRNAEMLDNQFVLSLDSQSNDGDFKSSNPKGYPVDWVITVNDNLKITEKTIKKGREYSDFRIGEKNGVAVYKDDVLLKDFEAGRVTAFIDYGDYYLVVSENITGIYENTPLTISSIWYYTETVYSLYNYNGEMIMRASVDSSPDYDVMLQNFVH